MKNPESLVVGDQTVGDWNRKWVLVPGGLIERQTHLNHKVGLYRVMWNDEIMAIGVGTQRKGGMAAKLSAFYWPSAGSRNYYTGRKVHQHREVLDVEVLITGEDELAREIARQLKTPIMQLKRPSWSVLDARYTRVG